MAMRKRQKQNLALAAVAAFMIAGLAGYSYSAEQARQAGFAFGNEILAVQESLKGYQSDFGSAITRWEEGDMTDRELDDFAEGHIKRMEDLIARYDELEPPEPFEASVAIFKLSAESQLESDREYVLWILTQDEAHLIRSDALIQESFEYDTAALGEFNRAKSGIGRADSQ